MEKFILDFTDEREFDRTVTTLLLTVSAHPSAKTPFPRYLTNKLSARYDIVSSHVIPEFKNARSRETTVEILLGQRKSVPRPELFSEVLKMR